MNVNPIKFVKYDEITNFGEKMRRKKKRMSDFPKSLAPIQK